MTINWKQTAGALALSAMTLGVTGGDLAMAKGKSAVLKPTPPDDVAPAEKGIKDVGVKSCNGCGMTGRQAAPPATGDGAAPPSAKVPVKGGQILEKPPRPHVMAREATPPPVDDAAAPPSAEKGKSATIPPVDTTLRDIGLKRTKSPNGQGGTLPTAAKPKKGSTALLALGGLAVIVGIIIASNGNNDDNPTSP
jgi:hypothetical protein